MSIAAEIGRTRGYRGFSARTLTDREIEIEARRRGYLIVRPPTGRDRGGSIRIGGLELVPTVRPHGLPMPCYRASWRGRVEYLTRRQGDAVAALAAASPNGLTGAELARAVWGDEKAAANARVLVSSIYQDAPGLIVRSAVAAEVVLFGREVLRAYRLSLPGDESGVTPYDSDTKEET